MYNYQKNRNNQRLAEIEDIDEGQVLHVGLHKVYGITTKIVSKIVPINSNLKKLLCNDSRKSIEQIATKM